MNQQHDDRRRRAICKVPIHLIQHLMGLDEGTVIISITQDWNDMVDGVVNFVAEGSALDPYFVTHGRCIEGQLEFRNEQDGSLKCTIVPPDSAEMPE